MNIVANKFQKITNNLQTKSRSYLTERAKTVLKERIFVTPLNSDKEDSY